jgi:hypothetical protein
MQSMTEFFKAGSQSKINIVLRRFFILSTVLLVVATWNIQHSSKPMFPPQVSLPSEHALIFERRNHQSVTTADPNTVELVFYEPNIDSQGKDNEAANIPIIANSINVIDSSIFPPDTDNEETKTDIDKDKDNKPESGENKKVVCELGAFGAAIVAGVALVIIGSPALLAIQLAIAFWGVARQSIEAMQCIKMVFLALKIV